ncbi:MAG TPA: hypothetical protein K8V56_10645 [Sporosarcina psychrophila]|uniref:Uncharacterized protein n=1 Tax=Sporosarcina psychrophila TaxID=1476 RepID=A0A921FYZ9_SPOPS|nr:hypothetical protein [Sporosarcina psychrophila]
MRKGNYNCFSYKLKDFLHANEVVYIHHQVHSVTNKSFWVYERNILLDELLNQWASNKLVEAKGE